MLPTVHKSSLPANIKLVSGRAAPKKNFLLNLQVGDSFVVPRGEQCMWQNALTKYLKYQYSMLLAEDTTDETQTKKVYVITRLALKRM